MTRERRFAAGTAAGARTVSGRDGALLPHAKRATQGRTAGANGVAPATMPFCRAASLPVSWYHVSLSIAADALRISAVRHTGGVWRGACGPVTEGGMGVAAGGEGAGLCWAKGAGWRVGA